MSILKQYTLRYYLPITNQERPIKIINIILIYTLFNIATFAQDACSRTAVINQQEVLIDSNATQKGEGLRHYLEKDKIAAEYLEKYQDGTKVKWHNAALGTLGTTMIISSFFVNSTGSNKETLLIGGITSIVVNFLMARTFESSNEKHLNRAILEYNKRNLPQIEYNQTGLGKDQTKSYKTVYLEKKWSF